MRGHKICLYGEIWLIIPKIIPVALLIWSSDESSLNISGESKQIYAGLATLMEKQ